MPELEHELAASATGGEASGIWIVDVSCLADVLDELITQAAGEDSEAKDTIRAQFLAGLAARGAIADPRAAPQYVGAQTHGNPITFFYQHYRLRVEAGAYYQSDLQRDNPRLFHALRNVLKHKDWQSVVHEAAEQIGQQAPATILGKHLRDVKDLADLLPARRGIEPRRPVEAIEPQRGLLPAE